VTSPGPAPRFLADRMLGRLARHLRMLGFDCTWRRSGEFADIAAAARDEGRVLLSRDSRTDAMRDEQRALRIVDDHPFHQARQVIADFDLHAAAAPLTRCMECNVPLQDVDRDAVRDVVPPYVFDAVAEYTRCPGCRRVYWGATHVERMQETVARLLERSR
jgi:hypothetical protein